MGITRVAELRSRVQQRTGHFYDTVFTRRVSVYLTALLAPMGVTANQVSTAGIGVGLASCLLIAFGSGWSVLVGILFVHLYAVLDSVDGELARLRRQFTLKGLYLEDLSAYYMIVGFPLAVAWHGVRAGLDAWPLVLAVVFGAFGRNGIAVARRAVIKSIQTKRPVSPFVPRQSATVSSVRRVIDGHLLNHTNIRFVVSSALAAETLAGRQPQVTNVLLVITLAGLLGREAATIAHMLRRNTLDGLLSQIYDDARTVNTASSQVDALQLAKY